MILLWIAAASAMTAASGCPSAHEARTQGALLEAENHWIKYLEGRDVTGLGCLLADDFTDNNARGPVYTKAEILAHLPERAAGTIDLKDVEIRVEGSMGYVRGRTISHNAQGAVVAQARFTDIYLYRDGHWRAVAAQETAIRD